MSNSINCSCGEVLETDYELEHGECVVCRISERDDELYACWEWDRCEGCINYLHYEAIAADLYDCDEDLCTACHAPCCNQTTMKDL